MTQFTDEQVIFIYEALYSTFENFKAPYCPVLCVAAELNRKCLCLVTFEKMQFAAALALSMSGLTQPEFNMLYHKIREHRPANENY